MIRSNWCFWLVPNCHTANPGWVASHSVTGTQSKAATSQNNVAHDWFSKDSVEPSRQALTELIKEHSTLESGTRDVSPKGRSRSRANTVTSSNSLYTRSSSNASNELTSRPSSQQSYLDPCVPLPDSQLSTAKTLLAKGTRMLKRQGSKLNLLPSQIEDTSINALDGKDDDLLMTQGIQRQSTLSSRREFLLALYSTRLQILIV